VKVKPEINLAKVPRKDTWLFQNKGAGCHLWKRFIQTGGAMSRLFQNKEHK
jgi:hypothetical protein